MPLNLNLLNKKAKWLEEIMAEHEQKLMRYCWQLTGNKEEAQEIVQETFLKLWKQDRSKVENHVRAWLYSVCRNHAMDILRKESRVLNFQQKKKELSEISEDDSLSPEDKLQAKETSKKIAQICKGLPERQQELVRLKFQEGLSYKEMAEVMSMSESNVGFQLHDAMNRLRKKFFLSQEARNE